MEEEAGGWPERPGIGLVKNETNTYSVTVRDIP